ncbi:PAS domain-containing protein [Novosphingobium kaempferiae]|uniref:PAS domain-containing protein n=1 Tax=Novosphingobium kaempferiae TaxID=2896849 RepID=UPI001E5B6500|nr:PAS domain-containing protein [Novosphingobium kaempferiae]
MVSASFRELLEKSVTGQELARTNWGNTSVGDIGGWSAPLKTLVSAVLACPTPMFLAWGDELLSFFNDAYRPILGQRAEGGIGMPFHALWHDTWTEIGPLVNRTLTGESVEMIDARLDIERQGKPVESWWTFSYSPVTNEEGVIAGLLCVTRETTQHVLATMTRQAAAEQLHAALAKGDRIGAWDWDVLNDRLTADRSFALIYNVDPVSAARGTGIAEFLGCIHPDDLPFVKAQIDATISYGDTYCAEYRILNSSGDVRWVSAQGRAVMNDDGKCVRFPGVSFDITINKKLKSHPCKTARSEHYASN